MKWIFFQRIILNFLVHSIFLPLSPRTSLMEFASLVWVYNKFITHHISNTSYELNKGTCGKRSLLFNEQDDKFDCISDSLSCCILVFICCRYSYYYFFFKEWFFPLVGGDHMKTKYPKSKSDSSLFMHNIFFRAIFLKFHECT